MTGARFVAFRYYNEFTFLEMDTIKYLEAHRGSFSINFLFQLLPIGTLEQTQLFHTRMPRPST